MARGMQVFPANDASPRHLKSRDPTSWASIRQAVGETRCVETRIVSLCASPDKHQNGSPEAGTAS